MFVLSDGQPRNIQVGNWNSSANVRFEFGNDVKRTESTAGRQEKETEIKPQTIFIDIFVDSDVFVVLDRL